MLSFKGLAFNAAYGLIGLLYAGLMQSLRASNGSIHSGWSATAVENEAFKASIGWFPWYLLLVLVIIVLVLKLDGLVKSPKRRLHGTEKQ